MFPLNSSNVVHESEGFCRVIKVGTEGKTLMTPAYFPAVSSYGVKYSFETLVRLLLAFSYPRILISAYDFHLLANAKKKTLSEKIRAFMKKGCFVFVDSGIYESFWKADNAWSCELYKFTLGQMDFDFYSSFDVLPSKANGTDRFTEDTFDNILACRKLSDKIGFMPILHGMCPDTLVSLVSKFVKEYPSLCNFLAIPERDCGNSVVERARTMTRIRRILDDDNNSNTGRVLHILGCGNPVSLLVYSYCGASTFDSLDWIKYAIDPSRLTINDFSHLELTGCECPVCTKEAWGYTEKVLLHNLLFYQNYMLQIQALIHNNEMRVFLGKHFGQNMLERIMRRRG
jgi:queuine/archaeosine tRNA-ribosyltransferase